MGGTASPAGGRLMVLARTMGLLRGLGAMTVKFSESSAFFSSSSTDDDDLALSMRRSTARGGGATTTSESEPGLSDLAAAAASPSLPLPASGGLDTGGGTVAAWRSSTGVVVTMARCGSGAGGAGSSCLATPRGVCSERMGRGAMISSSDSGGGGAEPGFLGTTSAARSSF